MNYTTVNKSKDRLEEAIGHLQQTARAFTGGNEAWRTRDLLRAAREYTAKLELVRKLQP